MNQPSLLWLFIFNLVVQYGFEVRNVQLTDIILKLILVLRV